MTIPDFVKLIIGFGINFNYFTNSQDIPPEDILSCINNIKEEFNTYDAISSFNYNLFSELSFAIYDKSNMIQPTNAQKFIKEMLAKTKNFLKDNAQLLITQADKGGKTVIIDKSLYDQKMNEFVNNNVREHTYFKINAKNTNEITRYMESKYMEVRRNINPYFTRDRENNALDWIHTLIFEPFVFSYLYGRIKIHKVNFPMRPIVSSLNCQAKSLSNWLQKKLNLIADHLAKHRVKSSQTVYDKLNGLIIGNDDRLVTWDYDNMFTNIPFSKTKNIIRKYYYLISKTTTVPLDTFIEAISFLIEDSSYFIFNDGIYRQCKGLTMGNALSQILAEIFTSEALNNAMESLPFEQPRFLGKFVDDLFTTCNKNHIEIIQETITKFSGGLKLKIENENLNREIPYLDNVIGVDSDNQIYFKLYQKPCSWRRILDFHSNHPANMKINITKEFITNALKRTSPTYWDYSIELITKTLQNSNYSNKSIKSLIMSTREKIGSITITSGYGETDSSLNIIKLAEEHKRKQDATIAKRSKKNSSRYRSNKHFRYQGYKLTKNNHSVTTKTMKIRNLNRCNQNRTKYISCPFYKPLKTFLEKKIKENGLSNVQLVPKPISKNRMTVFSNTKNKKMESDYIHSSFKVKCKNCSFSIKLKTRCLDIKRTLSHHVKNEGSILNEHLKDYPGHSFKGPFDVTSYANKRGLDLSCPYECVRLS